MTDADEITKTLEQLSSIVPSKLDEDDSLRLAEEYRQAKIKETKETLKKLEQLDDEDFVKKSLKSVSTTGQLMLDILMKEFEADPSSAAKVEAAAEIMNSINATMTALLEVGNRKKELELKERRVKVEEERGNSEGRMSDKNIFLVGSFTEVLKMIEEKKSNSNIIEAEVIKPKAIEEAKESK